MIPVPVLPSKVNETFIIILKWCRALLSVLGCLVVSFILADFVLDAVGFWSDPAAGFLAAFSTLLIAEMSAPRYERTFVISILFLGLYSAWLFMPHYYPESHPLAYQTTYIPFAATCLGGILGVIYVFVAGRKPRL